MVIWEFVCEVESMAGQVFAKQWGEYIFFVAVLLTIIECVVDFDF